MSKKNKYPGKAWYAFSGYGSPFEPLNYRKISFKPRIENGRYISAVLADDGGSHPAVPFSANVKLYLADALVSGEAQPAISEKHSGYFVHLKD